MTRIDEPLRYDRNTDPASDGSGAADDCLESGGSWAYFYHEEANTRVVMLSDEAGLVAERCDYTAYGEPQLRSGATTASAGVELGAARRMSAVGNPLLHQGLFRDGETGSYQNRYRQYASGLGRIAQRDPLGYVDGFGIYQAIRSNPLQFIDPMGLTTYAPVKDVLDEINRAREKNGQPPIPISPKLRKSIEGITYDPGDLPKGSEPGGCTDEVRDKKWKKWKQTISDKLVCGRTVFGPIKRRAWKYKDEIQKIMQELIKQDGLTPTGDEGPFWPLCCHVQNKVCKEIEGCDPACCDHWKNTCLQGGENACHGGPNRNKGTPDGCPKPKCCFTVRFN
ncbi:MAG: RHS repeat-associated core domain-containing protein [Phycisphaerae bacterium]|nr:RHS repeat-associated core domain-containing protein [Phycisphaerae bacterium]